MARFDRTERIVHWANATLFLVLIATGAALYAGPVSTLVGRRVLMKNIHVYTGLLLRSRCSRVCCSARARRSGPISGA